MNAESGAYRRSLVAVAVSGLVVGAVAIAVAGNLRGRDAAVAACLGVILGMVVALVGPIAMLVGYGRTPAALAGVVATGWLLAIAIAVTGLALARGLDDERRAALGLTFAVVVLAGLAAKTVVTARARVPYADPTRPSA